MRKGTSFYDRNDEIAKDLKKPDDAVSYASDCRVVTAKSKRRYGKISEKGASESRIIPDHGHDSSIEDKSFFNNSGKPKFSEPTLRKTTFKHSNRKQLKEEGEDEPTSSKKPSIKISRLEVNDDLLLVPDESPPNAFTELPKLKSAV